MERFPSRLILPSGAPVSIDRTRILLSFPRRPGLGELAERLAGADLALEPDSPGTGPGCERVNHSARRVWVRSRHPISGEQHSAVEAMFAEAGLEWIGPVYRLDGGSGRRPLLTPLPDVLLIRPLDPDLADGGDLGLEETRGRRALLIEVEEKSRFLGGYRYFVLRDLHDTNAYEIRQRLLEHPGDERLDVRFEIMSLLKPTAVVPNDPLFPQQWNMKRIGAGGTGRTGWDISPGKPGVVICILDEGCDLTHPDLVTRYSGPGVNLGNMQPPGSPTGVHGTPCAGVAAATFNNGAGLAGVAGECKLVSAAVSEWTHAQVKAGINWAAEPASLGGGGASVISMSFGDDNWDQAEIDSAIQNAFNAGLVMCVATQNHGVMDPSAITYPATNPLVMAVGASDQTDNRAFMSNYGPRTSVVAPGVDIPTTDIQGSSGNDLGDYYLTFGGTSAATPHVAGLAALVRGLYPTLSNVRIRSLIERTAEKVGLVPYGNVPGYPSGTWNPEMGYGRINVLRALDQADLLIRDMPGDTGEEPSPAGNFWDNSDIVVRSSDDGIFDPSNPLQSHFVELGQPNHIYVRLTNNGPATARNVTCTTRITPYVGLQFIYPHDWTDTDSSHVEPTPVVASFASIAPGASAIAKFVIDISQTQRLNNWQTANPWHPCLLARVTADNDYAFGAGIAGDTPPGRKNLAQRNLSVVDAVAGAGLTFPFVGGHRLDREETMTIAVDRSGLPPAMPLLLSLDGDGRDFPLLRLDSPEAGSPRERESAWRLLLEWIGIGSGSGRRSARRASGKGLHSDPVPRGRLGDVRVEGGEVVLRGGGRFVELRESRGKVTLRKTPGRLYPLALHTTIPVSARSGDRFAIGISQQDAGGAALGGASVIFVVG